MTQEEVIRETLAQEWRDECDIIGPAGVGNIVASVLRDESISAGNGSSAGFGFDFNVMDIVQLLAAAASLVKTCLEIARILRERRGVKPDQNEILQALQQRKGEFPDPVWKKASVVVARLEGIN